MTMTQQHSSHRRSTLTISTRSSSFSLWQVCFLIFSCCQLAVATPATNAAKQQSNQEHENENEQRRYLRSSSTTSTRDQQQQQQQQSIEDDRRLSFGARIVGGSDVSSGSRYPFFASWWYGCGGTLIASDMILTAAHCETSSLSSYPFSLGSPYKHDSNAPIVVYAKDYWVHPDYSEADGNEYDIMVLQLSEHVPFQTIRLNPYSSVPVKDQELVAIGHGAISEFGGYDSNDMLQEVTVNYIEDCKAFDYVYAGYNFLSPDSSGPHLCAGVDGGGKDACFGDSGGPLFYEDNSGGFVQVGVTSWGDGCARANAPGVYARVSTAFDFIEETVCDNSENPPDWCPGGGSGRESDTDSEASTGTNFQTIQAQPEPEPEPVPYNPSRPGSNGGITITLPVSLSQPQEVETNEPTEPPTEPPTRMPTVPPTEPPTEPPTKQPVQAVVSVTIPPQTQPPTEHPSTVPSQAPSTQPSISPSATPTVQATPLATTPSPTAVTPSPTIAPTSTQTTTTPSPTTEPTTPAATTSEPTAAPSESKVTSEPTAVPTTADTKTTTDPPTTAPTNTQTTTDAPTTAPTNSQATTDAPTVAPTNVQTATPVPTSAPTNPSTDAPTTSPTQTQTQETKAPGTESPTVAPTTSASDTPQPTVPATNAPTSEPTIPATDPPTAEPTTATDQPTVAPSANSALAQAMSHADNLAAFFESGGAATDTDSPTAQPTPAPAVGGLRIDIHTDSSPWELSFVLVHQTHHSADDGSTSSTGTLLTVTSTTIIEEMAAGTLQDADATYGFSFHGDNIPIDGSYKLTLHDAGHNGICCSNGFGNVKIYQLDEYGNDVYGADGNVAPPIVHFSGIFQHEHDLTFQLAAAESFER